MRTPSKTTKLPKAWLNASEQVLIGFSFASDWLRGGVNFLDQSQSEVNLKQKQKRK